MTDESISSVSLVAHLRSDGWESALGQSSSIQFLIERPVVLRSGTLGLQIPQPNHVVSSGSQLERPVDAFHTSQASFAEGADVLHPTEDRFDRRTSILAHRVAGVPSGTFVDRAASIRGVLGDMGCAVELTDTPYEFFGVVSLVSAEGYAMFSRQAPDHLQRHIAFSGAGRQADQGLSYQAVASGISRERRRFRSRAPSRRAPRAPPTPKPREKRGLGSGGISGAKGVSAIYEAEYIRVVPIPGWGGLRTDCDIEIRYHKG